MSMRILYLSQYFPPESGATQFRAFEISKSFCQSGHSVLVITEFPNHPSGIIPPEFRGKNFERAIMEDGVEIIRVWVKASPEKNFRSRMLFYLSYMFNAIFAGIFMARGRFDFIYCTSPPLFTGAAGLALSYFKSIPLVFEVRDMWPESAIILGELTNKRWVYWATRLEEACYRRAKKIITVTTGIKTRLIERGVCGANILVIPNGTNPDVFRFDHAKRLKIRKDLNIEDKFVVIYAGIFGIAQGLEIVLEAASSLQANPNIHFLMIGEGPRKRVIVQLANQHQLINVTILPEQPVERIAQFLSAADISIIPLRKFDLFTAALPSKIFDAWACKRPVLVLIDGEARELVEKVNAGVYVPPEDPDALAEKLIQLSKQPEMLNQFGTNGYLYAIEHCSRSIIAQKLIHELKLMFDPEQ